MGGFMIGSSGKANTAAGKNKEDINKRKLAFINMNLLSCLKQVGCGNHSKSNISTSVPDAHH